ncbi:rhomboid family intramembrane serine protease [Jatrophihabitans telluris]|uniref:Rhomboid family intramembrane serine protease n=1 Tax=Jatrophihabitans telluris TaxID=2038343 RepID=A0ABY4R236_9ACTN|nr:rhomboid family intramembrane serine protease [Jatrophihabitans telluris]UQX89597.1 rhomboid family intramembrane serine protease [Jatrophihabitans telluris]
MSIPEPGQPMNRRQQRRHELANTSMLSGLRGDGPITAVMVVVTAWVVLVVVAIVNAVLHHHLTRFGIQPRHAVGLRGIVLSPFLHADFAHLAANSIPFLALGWVMVMEGLKQAAIVTTAIILASGLIDWAIGPSSAVIVGASGVIFGWLGYVLARAWFSRNIRWIAIAIMVVAVFSGMFTGLLPRFDSHVFWAGHVAGFVVGVLTGALLHRRPDRA